MINVSKRSLRNCLSLNRLYQQQLVALPYLGTFSLNLRKGLYKSVSKSLPQCNGKVIFQSKNRLSNFFKFNDSIPLHICSHLVDKLQCSNCNITYYVESERHLKVSGAERISTSPLTGKRVNNNKKSSIKGHCFLSGGHVCLFGDFTIFNFEPHKLRQLIKESLLVTKGKPLLKKQAKLLKLDLFSFNSSYAIFYRTLDDCNYLIDIFIKNVITNCKQLFLTMGKVPESSK